MSASTREGPFASGVGAVWTPDESYLRRARVTRLLERTGAADVPELHERSLADPEWYWREVVDDLGVRFDSPFAQVRDLSDGVPFPRWFTGGTLNLSSNCLDRNLEAGLGDTAAIHWEDEARNERTVTYRQLHAETVAFARYLRSLGIEAGDRVGLFLPMCPEAAAAFLGCARIGAIAVTAFSGYGPEAVAIRMRACGARVLVCADRFTRKGQPVQMYRTARAVADAVGTIERLVVVARAGELPTDAVPLRDVTWTQALSSPEAIAESGEAVALEPNHPLVIIYTSGTTGEPKGMVHSHGGFLVKVAHDFGYCLDIQDDDTLFWVVDLGWVVGPLVIVGGLFLRAQGVYFEGVPNFTSPDQLWELVERNRVTVAGLSPTAVRSMMAGGEEWVRRHDLGAVRSFATAGEPWTPEAWHWLFEVVGERRVPLLNYSGGTEISGGILTCYPVMPIAPCGFNGPVLGMDADAVDLEGRTVRGEIGELVVRQPWPGMTHGFWNDQERYLATYWSQLPDVWTHGDMVVIDDAGYWHIRGRSDDTIMVAGKRIGPAEVEAAIIAHPEVDDAAAIGVPDVVKGEHIAAFVTRVDGGLVDERLSREIRALVAERVGPTLVPSEIVGVRGFPKTRTAKIMRRLIRARYLGNPTGDLSGLDDLTTLDLIPVKP